MADMFLRAPSSVEKVSHGRKIGRGQCHMTSKEWYMRIQRDESFSGLGCDLAC